MTTLALSYRQLRRLGGKLRRRVNIGSRVNTYLDTFALKRTPPLRSVDHSEAVFLTFDDGPHPEYTALLAKLLSDRDHKATFFFAGEKALEEPALVANLMTQGHAIGSHSSKHLPQWETSSPRVLFDYWSGHRSIERALGSKTHLFRPPYGHQDWRSSLFIKLKRLDLVLWDTESYDWKPDATAASVVANVTNDLPPGSIVLMHDAILDNPEASDRSHTLAALEEILDYLEANGLRSEALI